MKTIDRQATLAMSATLPIERVGLAHAALVGAAPSVKKIADMRAAAIAKKEADKEKDPGKRNPEKMILREGP